MNFAIFCHDENLLFAQPQECLSVTNSPVVRNWKTRPKTGIPKRCMRARSNPRNNLKRWTPILPAELQPAAPDSR
jgi:hypothetical protein